MSSLAKRIAISLALGLGATGVSGQNVIITRTIGGGDEIPPEVLAMLAGEGDGASGEAAQAGAGGEASAGASPRLEKLKALTYDRRASAILAAWSTPLEPFDPEAVEGDGPDAAAAEGAPDAASEVARGDGDAAASLQALGYLGASPVSPSGTTPATTLLPASTGVGAAEAAPATAEAQAEAEAADEAPAGEVDPEAAAAADAKALEARRLAYELEQLQRLVTLGRWSAVADVFAGFTPEEAEAGYAQLLKSLAAGPPRPQSPFAAYAEGNVFAPEDVVGVMAAVPAGFALEAAQVKQLAKIIEQCRNQGYLAEQLSDALSSAFDDERLTLSRNLVADALIESGHGVEAGRFLPSPAEAVASDDREALNLLSRHYLAMEHEDGEGAQAFLEQAWDVTQAVLADGEVGDDVKAEALKRAVDIAPRIRDELGQRWLDESFTSRPERGMEILRVIGSASSAGLLEMAHEMERRQAGLELQTTAAEALLAVAPERAGEWSGTLTLLASNWLKEADVTYRFDWSTSQAPQLERDLYGNFFYYNRGRQTPPNQPVPILTGDVLGMRPSDAWLATIDPELLPRIAMVTARLLLKVNDEAEAFPYIERLAATHPGPTEELVDEFLRVWIANHDPNGDSRRSNYVYFFGYEERADGIPLTRSKQERNLAELADWVARLRALPLDGLDQDLLTQAFTTAHSQAEVYRLETIEQVFGPMGSLDPGTVASLAQRMRANLAEVWRDPAVQKESQTNRRRRDLQAEVLRGYDVARAVVEQALEGHPDDWALQLAHASVIHDELNYQRELQQDSAFASERQASFDAFARAAEAYLAALPGLEREDESPDVYTTWFYASLGACDLKFLDSDMVQAVDQLPRIQAALQALPEEARDRHVGEFANVLFTRMGNVNPAVKFRYVRAGLELVGGHERARYAQEVYDYYADLVTEIELDARIDGSDVVGHGEPFGVFVDIRHTKEIEREAGGFGKYLVNQNNNGFSWNYGRPTENYRDKFEDGVREALDEHFEVLSVTFNHADAHSRAIERYGWRVTPYAYLLLKPRGPQVDTVPSVHLDLDFLDTTGYAVLPVESDPVPIEATSVAGEPRPFEGLELVQTLDERQAASGRLVLEVSARARGLLPDLDALVDFSSDGFVVESIEDQGVSVSQFDQDGDETAVHSERSWSVVLEAAEGLTELPQSYRFPRPRREPAELVFQRYDDADLVEVGELADLQQTYGERDTTSWWLLGGGGLLALGALALLVRAVRGRSAEPSAAAGYVLPEHPSPFQVMGLLRHLDAGNGLAEAQRADLRQQLDRLERYYFEDESGEAPDVDRIAREWIARAN